MFVLKVAVPESSVRVTGVDTRRYYSEKRSGAQGVDLITALSELLIQVVPVVHLSPCTLILVTPLCVDFSQYAIASTV